MPSLRSTGRQHQGTSVAHRPPPEDHVPSSGSCPTPARVLQSAFSALPPCPPCVFPLAVTGLHSKDAWL